jgi:hypothetical protein
MLSPDPARRPIRQHPEFARGVRDMTGTALGIAAWGLGFAGTLALLGLTCCTTAPPGSPRRWPAPPRWW